MLRALDVADFRLLWAGRLVSDLGSYLLIVAIPFHVHQLTGSATATGLTLAVESLPAVLVGPMAGVRVDRWNRRRIMIAADLLRAGAILLILFADRPERVWWVYLALLAESLGTVFFRPAARAMTPDVVGLGPDLVAANSLNALSTGTVRLVGPPLGAALLVWSGLPALILLDAASYLVSALAITAITTRTTTTGDGSAKPLRDGLAFTAGHPVLRGLLVLNTAFFTANAVFTALLVPFVSQRFTDSPGAVGYLVSALGAGYLLGAPVAGLLVRRLTPSRLMLLGQTGVGLCFAAMVNAPTLVVAIAAAGIAGVPGSVLMTTIDTTVQRGAPSALRGRVGAAFHVSDAVAALLGASAAAVLGAHHPITSVLTWSAVAILCTAAAGLLILP
ncbi:MFS transporter [Umezawaea sp. Da 62-37]|uniref:MFS transporter n=1 Tax=Umezawaea sp. Da 62-37 TaxID=3075927 RepID=UPI0028F6EF02|nr:MFS transporter [Umezawaea sp. Da 62-37]WNV85555.1 MFS transporter [Umezawaea sp. Da 62-37]